MTYRELLQAYKDGTLDEEKKKEIESDIEKQDAISDYLFDNSEIPELKDMTDNSAANENNSDSGSAYEAQSFAKLINSRIRRAFIKAGICTAVITLAVVGFVMFALPKIVDNRYYDPTETVGKGSKTGNRLSVDIATYSELFLPTNNMCSADAIGRGYGKYYISLNRIENSYPGTLEKGDLRLYNPNILNRTIKEAYTADANGQPTIVLSSPMGYCYPQSGDIQHLDDYHYHTISVTLNKSMRYDDFANWCKQNNITPLWNAISTYVYDGNSENLPLEYLLYDTHAYSLKPCIGFGADLLIKVAYDSDKYPNLSAFDTWVKIREGAPEYDTTLEHVTSLLNYLIDNPEFVYMIDDENATPEVLQKYKDVIEKNGLYIYGFVCSEDKANIERIMALAEVAHVNVDVQ